MSDVLAGRICPRPLRLVWPRFTRKHVARRFGIAAETAKSWLRDGVPSDRRAELRAAILAECDRLEGAIAELRAAMDGER